MNEQEHVAAVGKFIRFFIRFSGTDFSVSERHWRYLLIVKRGINFIESDYTLSCTLARDLMRVEVD